MSPVKPRGEGWQQFPTVTPGGKTHFWFRRNPETDAREWYVWDRINREWVHQTEAENAAR